MVSLTLNPLLFNLIILMYFILIFTESECKNLNFDVIGLADLTLTSDAPDAGDEDVFMVRKNVKFYLLTSLIKKI